VDAAAAPAALLRGRALQRAAFKQREAHRALVQVTL
jgi:hypothetical protein